MADSWIKASDGTWTYGDGNGNNVKNSWQQYGGKWYYLGNNGIMATNTTTPDGYNVDGSGAWDGVAKNGEAPILPTENPFTFNKSMGDYVTQAHGLLAPQLQSNLNKINDQYTLDLANANNDTLRRGLGRSTYAGNRQDQVTFAKNRNVSDAQLNNDIQANSMASDLYNTDYNRAYQLYSDQVNNDWKKYGALYDAYRSNVTDSQWQKNFDEGKREFDQNYALSLKKAASGGGSGSGKSAGAISIGDNSDLHSAYDIYHSNQDEQSKYNEFQLLNDSLANDNSQAATETRSYLLGGTDSNGNYNGGAIYHNYINYKKRTGNREYE